MKPILLFAATLFAVPLIVAAADEPEKNLGLNEFRHVKTSLTAFACGPNAWENGNYFENDPRAAERLFSPNEDTLTIKLKGAYFDYAPERSGWWPRMNKYEVQVGIFAEIGSKGTALTVPGAGGVPGRLVFYSDDHYLGQRRIPDVNTNIYGPVMYPGGGLAIKLSMLEFDQKAGDKLQDTLLKSVAELGSKASSGIPAYLEGPLTSLFQSALSSAKSRDDMFGQITFVLDDRNGRGNAPTSPLRTGDIVVVRQTIRANPIDWNNLCYKPSTGEVYWRETPEPGKERDRNAPKPNPADQPGTADGSMYFPPKLNYVTISLMKNAGADAGRIQDALTYERLVAELQQRKSDAGLISSVTAVTTALNERATDRELVRQIEILGRSPGSVSAIERSDAANLVGRVVYASLLDFNGFDLKSIAKLDECAFLRDEKIKQEWLTRLFVRLASANPLYTRVKLAGLASAPANCVEANRKLLQIHEYLLAPS